MLQCDIHASLATQAKPAKWRPSQRTSTRAESRAWEPSSDVKIPPASRGHGSGNQSPHKSFDALASHLQNRCLRLAADIEDMRKELRAAEERSEQLKHDLLNGKLPLMF